jgi:hypothetical protein
MRQGSAAPNSASARQSVQQRYKLQSCNICNMRKQPSDATCLALVLLP